MAQLNPQVIGKEMPHGFAGCYARQPDMIVETRPAGGTAAIPYGTPLAYGTKPAVVPAGAGFTAADFAGVAGFEIKSALTYRCLLYTSNERCSRLLDEMGTYLLKPPIGKIIYKIAQGVFRMILLLHRLFFASQGGLVVP